MRTRRPQHGYVAMLATVLLILGITASLALVMRTAGSGAIDAKQQADSVAALYLAESGIERATRRYLNADATCQNLTESAISLGRGSFTLTSMVNGSNQALNFADTTASMTSRCRVRSVGTITGTNVSRTVESIISLSSSNSNKGSPKTTTTFGYTVDPGSNLYLVVGVSWNAPATSITSVNWKLNTDTGAGTNLRTNTTSAKATATNIASQLYWIKSPAVGTGTITVNGLSGVGSLKIVVGAFTVGGAVQNDDPTLTTPGSANSGTTATVTGVTSSASSIVIDLMSNTKTSSIGTPSANRTSLWSGTSGSLNQWGSYTVDTVAAGGSWTWTWSNNDSWAHVAVVLDACASGCAGGGDSGKVRAAGRGVAGWRELVQ